MTDGPQVIIESSGSAESGGPTEMWRDPAAAPAERVHDLISRMTIREKVAQLCGVWVGIDAAGGDVVPHQHDVAIAPADWGKLIGDGVGQLTRPFRSEEHRVGKECRYRW